MATASLAHSSCKLQPPELLSIKKLTQGLDSSMSFSDMKNAVIGVQATEYLKHMIQEAPAHEPLLAALGGEPIALRHYIGEELDRWKQNQMRPLFVFDGQSIVGKEDVALRAAMTALERTKKAWKLYGENEPSEAVKSFGASGTSPSTLYLPDS